MKTIILNLEVKMAAFEKHENGVVWTNGDIGALLVDPESLWQPFRYFNNGDLDISDESFRTAARAFEYAITYYS